MMKSTGFLAAAVAACAAVAADGTKTFTFRNYDGVRALRLEFAGKGVVRLSNFRCCRGFIMTVW